MFGSEEQKGKWLEPLLKGEIRSCFCMTGISLTASTCIVHHVQRHRVTGLLKSFTIHFCRVDLKTQEFAKESPKHCRIGLSSQND